MLVKVATVTGAIQSQICFAKVGPVFFQSRFVAQQFLAMTFPAVGRGMFSFQQKAGLGVVKGFLSPFEIYQFIIPPLMLDMTELTFFIVRIAVQSFLLGLSGSNCGMAGEAFGRNLLGRAAMAFAAVINSFQKGMSAVQFAGRNLRPGNGNQERPGNEEQAYAADKQRKF